MFGLDAPKILLEVDAEFAPTIPIFAPSVFSGSVALEGAADAIVVLGASALRAAPVNIAPGFAPTPKEKPPAGGVITVDTPPRAGLA